jgi:prolyl oligopeptidase
MLLRSSEICSFADTLVFIGKAWCSDYGDPHDPHDFDFIYPISPLHNIPTDKVLPPMILLTADRACYDYSLSALEHAEISMLWS